MQKFSRHFMRRGAHGERGWWKGGGCVRLATRCAYGGCNGPCRGISPSRARERERALSVCIVWVCVCAYVCVCVFVCECVYIYERHIYRAWMTWQCRHSETKRLARAADKVISLILTMLSCSDGSVPASSEANSSILISTRICFPASCQVKPWSVAASMPPQHPDLLSCFDACSETLSY